MAIFVTGGTGFIGSYVTRLLLARGETVHLLVREKPVLPKAAHLKLCVGDVRDIGSLSQAIHGCDRIIHMAACARAWAPDPITFHEVNVTGTSNVLTCAAEAGVSRIVYTSSCSAVRVIDKEEATEADFAIPENLSTEYALSKHLAELQVVKYGQSGPYAVIVYPTRVYGPGPLNDANGATKALSLYLRNTLPFPRSMLHQIANWAFVADVARGHVLALDNGVPGERYILGGVNADFCNVLGLVDRVSGRKHIKLALPDRLVNTITGLQEVMARGLGAKPLVTRQWVTALGQRSCFSSAKAARELGYRITPLENGLETTVAWLMQRSIDNGNRSGSVR